MKNIQIILFCAAFLILGFLLGRVTAHHGPKGCEHEHGQESECPHASSNGGDKECCAASGGPSTHGDLHWVSCDDEDIQIMMLEGEDFEGDTVIVLPGGEKVNVVRNGEEIEVEVEMNEELDEDMTKRVNVVRTEGPGGDVRVEKKVVIIQED